MEREIKITEEKKPYAAILQEKFNWTYGEITKQEETFLNLALSTFTNRLGSANHPTKELYT